jgi:hypothetical protein
MIEVGWRMGCPVLGSGDLFGKLWKNAALWAAFFLWWWGGRLFWMS